MADITRSILLCMLRIFTGAFQQVRPLGRLREQTKKVT